MYHVQRFIQKNIPVTITLLAVVFTITQITQLVTLFGITEVMADVVGSIQTPIARASMQADTDEVKISKTGKNICENNTIANGETPVRIVIPVINLDLPIESAQIQGNTWPVQEKVANFASETSLLRSTGGNVGLFGHDRTDAFRPIKHLKQGDTVIVYTENLIAYYTISTEEITQANNVSVFYQTDTPILTLLTCDGLFSEQRYVLHARLDHIVSSSCV